MSDRASQIILLCEDELHERLVKAYMKECGLETQEPCVRSLVASRLVQGGNVDWVLREFPGQVQACRQRQKRAKTLLVVMADADKYTVQQRLQHFNDRLQQQGAEPLGAEDPIILLIPRRHGETWLASLLGKIVTEEEDCKGWNKPTKDEIRQAASTAYQWARPNAKPGATCVSSLKQALADWHRIG
jgi:hypothetical protein